MKKIKLYILDTNEMALGDLESSKYVTDADITKAKRYAMEMGKKEHLASDYFKNRYVGDYYYNEHNKPVSDKTFFNISHSYGYIAFAICEDAQIGVDIELNRNVKDDLIKYVSNDDEFKFIKSNKDFYKIWTTKESVTKCNGEGILRDIKTIPGLPIDGVKEFNGNKMFSKLLEFPDYLISITIMDSEDFEVEVINEVIE